MFKYSKLKIVTHTPTKHVFFFFLSYNFQYLNNENYCLESLTKHAFSVSKFKYSCPKPHINIINLYIFFSSI